MPEQLIASLPFLPLTLGLMVLWFCVPLLGETGRRRATMLFALGAIALFVFASQRAGSTRTLEVVNPFPQGADMRSVPVVTERVSAAGWEWPVAAGAFLALLALLTFGSTRLPSRAPSPVARCLLIGSAFAALRLTLEKTAAPAPLVWAVGGSIGLPIVVAFAGLYAGRRGQRFAGFALSLLLLAVLQRALITGFAYFATMRRWGTHLDVNAISELNTPIGGLRRFAADDPQGKWTWAILVPQMVLWVAVTLVLGLVLGGIAWRLSRTRRPSPKTP